MKIMNLLSRMVGAVILAVLLSMGFPAASPAGKVQPLPMGSATQSGVHPLLEPDRTGSVQPLAMEDTANRLVVAQGWATIFNGNVGHARVSALQMAYAEAVGRVSGVEIGSLMLIRNVKQVSDVVVSRSRGFIRRYLIIREGLSDQDSSRYEVVIEAEVVESGSSQDDEKEGLGLFLDLLGDPNVLIMLPEKRFRPTEPANDLSPTAGSEKHEEIEIQKEATRIRIHSSQSTGLPPRDPLAATGDNGGQGTSFSSAEAALAQAFSNFGYQTTTSDDLLAQGLVAPEVMRQAKAGVTVQALKVARAAGADIALVGVLRLSQDQIKPAGVSMTMVTAEASAKAIIVSSGKKIQAFHQTQRASAPSELKAYADCLDKAAGGIADVLAWKIPQMLTRESRETRVVIHGAQMPMIDGVRDALAALPGVELVRFGRLPTRERPVAELVLQSGFVRVSEAQIVACLDEALPLPAVLLRADKYQLEISLPATKAQPSTSG